VICVSYDGFDETEDTVSVWTQGVHLSEQDWISVWCVDSQPAGSADPRLLLWGNDLYNKTGLDQYTQQHQVNKNLIDTVKRTRLFRFCPFPFWANCFPEAK